MAKTKVLLIGINKYTKLDDYDNLASSNTNVKLIKTALEDTLNLSNEDIKVCKGVHRNEIFKIEFIDFLNENISNMKDEDSLILYFTGHGDKGKIILSDGEITYKEIIDIIEKKKIKNKVFLLDCCYSGTFDFYNNYSELYEHGYAVMASCKKDEESYTCNGFFYGQKCKMSAFTFFLATSLMALPIFNLNFYNGKLSLENINIRLKSLIESNKHKEEICLKSYKKLLNKDNIDIATIHLNKNNNMNYIYKTNVSGNIEFDIKNSFCNKPKYLTNISSSELNSLKNELKKINDTVQLFIKNFRNYCNQDINEQDLIKKVEIINKELIAFRNDDELVYESQKVLKSLKVLASSLGFYYNPEYKHIITENKGDKQIIVSNIINYYNYELSFINNLIN